MSSRRLLLPAFTLLGLVLRLVQLGFQPLWWDEGYSVFFATRDFATMLARTAVDIHPPLYYALMQLWSRGVGTGDVALRLLSVLLGVAAIPLLYFVARELFNSRVGYLAAFLLAIAPLHIYYSQELRMYGLVTLLTLASVALQLKILAYDATVTRPRPWSTAGPRFYWLAYIVVTALSLYTQYFAVFVIMAEILVVLYLVFRARWQLDLKQWIMSWGAIAVLYLPWVLYAGPKLFVYVTNKVGIEQYNRLDPVTYLVQHLVAFSTGHLSNWMWVAWGAILFALLALLGVLASRRYQAGEGNSQFAIQNPIAAIYLFAPLTLGFLVNLIYTFHPVRYERLLLFAAPFFLVYVACGLVSLWQRERALGALAAAVLTIVCGLALYDFYTVPRYADEDYRPLIQDMQTYAAENDLAFAIYPWQIGYLKAYYRGAPLNINEVDADAWIKNPELMRNALNGLRDQNPRAWILAYQKQGRILEDRLTNEYINDYVIYDQTFGNTRLEYFAQGNETDFELAPIVFGTELTLRLQYAAFDSPSHPHLALARFAWNASTDAFAYSLRVVDGAGGKIAQQDASIQNGSSTLRRGLALPDHLAAGDYILQIVAYRRADGAPLEAANGAAAISLAKITIAP